mgnify:CR=1 FL=1
MELTKNQKEIITKSEKNSFIKINAFAGTGKTTTLKCLTETYKNKKFLYLVFNKSMSDDAKKKFPNNEHLIFHPSINISIYKQLENEVIKNNSVLEFIKKKLFRK